jgi:hypothetical protein
MPEFFNAHQVIVGYCGVPECRCVHVQLLDADGEPRAQAVIACEEVEAIIGDLQKVRAHVLGGHTSLGRH